jgi:hypothetical protein
MATDLELLRATGPFRETPGQAAALFNIDVLDRIFFLRPGAETNLPRLKSRLEQLCELFVQRPALVSQLGAAKVRELAGLSPVWALGLDGAERLGPKAPGPAKGDLVDRPTRKAQAVKWLVRQTSARSAFYVGGDGADLGAFTALDELVEAQGTLLYAVKVVVYHSDVPDELVGAADIVVDGSSGFERFLRALLS